MTAQLIKDFSVKLKAAFPNGTPVRPALGKDYKFPAVTYAVRNGMRDLFYKDSYGLQKTEFTVNIFCKTYDELQSLKDGVVSAFHGFSGAMGSSTVGKAEVVTVLDGFDDDLELIYRTTILINILD